MTTRARESGRDPAKRRIPLTSSSTACSALSPRAKEVASELFYSKEVTLQTSGHDMYKHPIEGVVLPDGANVNHSLV